MTNEFLKDHPELEKLFERLTAEPDSHVFAPLADSCRKIGRLEEALEICRTGVERHPEYTSGHVVLGKCYYDQGDKANAKTAFQKVLSLDENNLVALKYLGMILAEQGDAAAAMERFKHILALDPDNLEIRNKLESLQDTEAAVAETIDTEPAGEEDEEILLLDEILEEDFEGSAIRLGSEEETSDELATLTLADIYASQGYLHKAKGIYEEVLRKWPDHSRAKAKLAALELEQAKPAATAEGDMEAEETPTAEDLRADASDDAVMESPRSSAETPADEREGPSSVKDEDLPDAEGKLSTSDTMMDAALDEVYPASKGKPIDSCSDIEKFKKWLQRMND